MYHTMCTIWRTPKVVSDNVNIETAEVSVPSRRLLWWWWWGGGGGGALPIK